MTPTPDNLKALVENLRESITDYGNHGESIRNEVMADLLAQTDRLEAALTATGEARVGGPDYFDGCEREGFVGGCERMGCPPSVYRCAEALNLAVCEAAAKGAIDPDHPSTDAVVEAGMALTAAMKATPAQPQASDAKDAGRLDYKAAYEAMVAGVEKAMDEIEDAGPKALKYAAQELRAALQSADAAMTAAKEAGNEQ